MIFKGGELLDFRNFLYLCWKHLNLPDPTPVQYDMANALQNIVKPVLGLPVDPKFAEDYPHLCDDEGKPCKRLILEAFRGVGKSWISSALAVWCLAIRPDLNILVLSASKARSDDFTTFCLRLIKEMDILAPLQPRADQRSSKLSFDVGPAPAAHMPSLKSIGVMGAMAGSRADIIIPDDVEIPNNSETQTMRDKLSERVKELDAILKPGGVIIYLGTPQTEDSLYNELEARRYTKMIWPGRFPGPAWLNSNGHAFAPLLRKRLDNDSTLASNGGLDGDRGAPTDPVRFDEFDLQEREASYGRSGFDLQFMLDTSLSDADRYPLKLADLVVASLNPEMAHERYVWGKQFPISDVPTVGFRGDRFHSPLELVGTMQEYQGSIMAVDPAGRGKDEMSWAVIKQLNGYLFLTECRGVLGGYTPDNLSLLARRAKAHGCSKIVIESNFGDGMFSELLKPILRNIYPCTIEEVRHNQQKERRIIETLEPVMNQHRLIVDKQVIFDDVKPHKGESSDYALSRQLFHQMTRVTKDRGCLRHDDRLDVVAIGVNFWTTAVAQDSSRKLQEREWKDYTARMRHLLGRRVRGGTAKTQPAKPSFFGKLR